MRLSVEMAIMNMDGEISAVAVGEDNAKFHGMLRLNEEAADIITILNMSRNEGISFDNLVRSLHTRYTNSTLEEIAKFTEEFLEKLWQEGLLIAIMTTSYKDELKKSGKIIFTIKGVSMRPLFRTAEDAIFVETCDPEKLNNLDIVLFLRMSPSMGEQYVLHRIVGRRKDGQFIIAGDNCIDYDIVDPKDILGVVKSAQRGNKPIKLTGFRYALYKYLWTKPYKFRSFVLFLRRKIINFGSKIKRFLKK